VTTFEHFGCWQKVAIEQSNAQKCNYSTKLKQSWKRHLNSQKHKSIIVCEFCNKQITSRATYYRHKKMCCETKKEILLNELEVKETKIIKLENFIKNSDYNNKKLSIMVEKIVENQKISLNNQNDLKSKQSNTINNLSINVYLNETCKNAMNLKDFMDQVCVSLDDLLYTKDNGYIKGISNIFIKNLKDINPKERPICCSNLEKQHFYVKESNKWEEDDKNQKINQSIRILSKKQLELTKDWLRVHPNFIDNQEELEEYHLMIRNLCTNDKDEIVLHDSIIKNVGECVNVDGINVYQ